MHKNALFNCKIRQALGAVPPDPQSPAASPPNPRQLKNSWLRHWPDQ